ncbi:RDD family protein [Staphylococcus chromogenes]|nr:RDD family protein [Staphylococcus chromogenes]
MTRPQQSRPVHRVGKRLHSEWRDAMQPPTQYGEMEVYQAFLPGRNTGQRSIDNAPVVKRVSALAIDLALFLGTTTTIVVAMSIALGQPWLLAFLLAQPLGFFLSQSAFDATGGTVGKRAMGLRVVGPAHTPVDFAQAAKRNTWLLLPLIPVAGPVAVIGVGMWFAGVAKADAFGVAPHDRHARTRVVQS